MSHDEKATVSYDEKSQAVGAIEAVKRSNSAVSILSNRIMLEIYPNTYAVAKCS